jgi:hypothetical protein
MRKVGTCLVSALSIAAVVIACTDLPTPTENASDIAQPGFAAIGPIVESVTGSGHVYRPFWDVWRTFSVAAIKRGDGTVRGNLQIANHGDFPYADSRGPVTCFTVDGNQAWIGSIILRSLDPADIGLEIALRVVDNGEGSDADPDQISTAYEVESAQQFCADTPDWPPLRPIEAGSIQVHQ